MVLNLDFSKSKIVGHAVLKFSTGMWAGARVGNSTRLRAS
jgi:hypothetical protein